MMLNSILKNFSLSLFKQPNGVVNSVPNVLNQIRTRVTCSRVDGKQKSVKTAMDRFLRLGKKVWIQSQPGYHKKLWLKQLEKRYLLQQFILCNKSLSRTVERMAGNYYKKINLNHIVDGPLTLYKPYLPYKPPKKKYFP